MKKLIYLLIIPVLAVSLFAFGAEPHIQLSLERAARIVASSYASGNPNENLFSGNPDYFPLYPRDVISSEIKVSINIEHSLEEKIEPITHIQGFEEYANWLDSVRTNYRFPDNLKVRTLGQCNNGCCEYPATYGISHNTLYLQKACFTINGKNPYLTSIYLLDGD